LVTDDGDERWADILTGMPEAGMSSYVLERQDLWSDIEHADYWEHHAPLWPGNRPGRSRNGTAIAGALLAHKLVHDTDTETAVHALGYEVRDLATRTVSRAWTDPDLTVLKVLDEMEHELDHFPGFMRVPYVVALTTAGERVDSGSPDVPWLPFALRNTVGVRQYTFEWDGQPALSLPHVRWDVRSAASRHARSAPSQAIRTQLLGLGGRLPTDTPIGASLRQQVRSGLRAMALVSGLQVGDECWLPVGGP
jgi:hypothetical protein